MNMLKRGRAFIFTAMIVRADGAIPPPAMPVEMTQEEKDALPF